jgi:hypothetical protein
MLYHSHRVLSAIENFGHLNSAQPCAIPVQDYLELQFSQFAHAIPDLVQEVLLLGIAVWVAGVVDNVFL